MTEDIPLEITSSDMANLPIFIAVLIVATVVVRVYFSIKHNEKPPIARVFWCATLLIPLGMVAAWITNQLLVNEDNSLWVLSYSALGAAAVILLVEPLVSGLIDQTDLATGTVVCICRDILVIAAVSALSFVSLEIACNETFYRIPANSFGFSVGLLATVLLSLYLLGQRHGGVMALVPVACCILGIAEHFVITFKGEAILPSDILALGTAMEVSEGYEFTFTAGIVTSLALLEISLGLLSLIRPRKLRTPTHVFPAIAANLCAFLLVTVVELSGFSSIDLEQALDFGFDRWQPITTYTSQGFITSFTEMVNELPIEKPEGYTPDEAQSIEQELAAAYDSTYGSSEQRAAAVAQFNEIKPTIVAVMNESFSDLSCFEQLQAAGYTGPAFYNSLPDTLVRGTMLASVTGGGTANSEFEFLTGATTAFVGLGKIPYQLYQMNGVNSLAKDLKELGYTATAMHPQNPVNYHRDKIYQQLGFGDFLSIGDFEGAPCYHAGVCDYATYDKILDLLRTDEAPQFIFDVTMQNHGGYDYGTVPAEELTNYWVEGASEGANSALNTYLTCITHPTGTSSTLSTSSAISADRLSLSFLATISRAPQRLSTTSCTLRKIRQATLSVSISRHILSGLTMKSPAIPSSTSTTPSGQTRLQPLPLIRSAPRSPTIKRLCLQQGQMCPPSMSPATLVPTGCATTWNLKTAHTPRRSTSCSACNTSSSPAKFSKPAHSLGPIVLQARSAQMHRK